MDYNAEFDGVWANASLIHVPYSQLPEIFQKIYNALKPQGVFYASFKYGAGQRQEGERYFYDMNSQMLKGYMSPLFEIKEIFESEDSRGQRQDGVMRQSWISVISQKI